MLWKCLHAWFLATAPLSQLEQVDQGWCDDVLVTQYFHHSELQRQWAWELMGRYPLQGDEVVLDFGCGDGKIAAEVSHCLPNGRIVGVDLSESMIRYAQRIFPQTAFPSLSFLQAKDVNFTEVDLPSDLQFDRIQSFCVFHLVAHPERVLAELRERIRDDGRLLLVVPSGGNPAFYGGGSRLMERYGLPSPWNSKAGPSMRTREGAEAFLTGAGWQVEEMREVSAPFVFASRDEFVQWFVGTTTANWKIPLEVAPTFFSDLVDEMVAIDPTIACEDGSYLFRASRLHIVACPSKGSAY